MAARNSNTEAATHSKEFLLLELAALRQKANACSEVGLERLAESLYRIANDMQESIGVLYTCWQEELNRGLRDAQNITGVS